MDLTENVGDRGRLARVLLAVALTVAAIRSFRNGKRIRGLLATAGAVALGVTARTEPIDEIDALDRDTAGDDSSTSVDITETHENSERKRTLNCAACGDPIVPGQGRGPNENGAIVHDDCA